MVEFRTGHLGAVILRHTVDTEVWANRCGHETSLFITEPGKVPQVITMPNAAADALAAMLLGTKEGGR